MSHPGYPTDETTMCKECGGMGLVWTETEPAEEVECSRCKGTGSEPCFICGAEPEVEISESCGVSLCSNRCAYRWERGWHLGLA